MKAHRLLVAALTVALVLGGRTAPAAEDADVAAARRLFDEGSEAYAAGNYLAALAAFEKANAVKPSAMFDYNMGRCLDRLDRGREAADAYERYVRAVPDGFEVRELRDRIVVLRARASPRRTPIYKRWWPWTLLGVAVAGGVAVGLGVGLTAAQRSFSPTIPDQGPSAQAMSLRF